MSQKDIAKKDTPYTNLPPKAFWRPAVGDLNPLSFNHLYTKKFTIDKNDRIVTAGSCFAQHIARKLKASGFNFCDYEPAPNNFPPSLNGNTP